MEDFLNIIHQLTEIEGPSGRESKVAKELKNIGEIMVMFMKMHLEIP